MATPPIAAVAQMQIPSLLPVARLTAFPAAADSTPVLKLWPMQTVEATLVIRPMPIAEIKRGTGEGVGLEGSPDWIGQVSAGSHDNRQIARSGDVESELIGPHPEAAVTGLNLRIPQLATNAGQR